MFEQSFVSGGRTRRPWTVAISLLLQCVLVGIMVLIPLIYTEAFPKMLRMIVLEPPSAPPPAVPPTVRRGASAKAPPSQFERGRLLAPRHIPEKIAIITDETPPPPLIPLENTGGVPGGTGPGAGRYPALNISGTGTAAPPPAPVTKPQPARKVRVGGIVQQAKLISQQMPQYPLLAKQARISGTVRLAAVISEAGMIEYLRVIQGHPLLIQAAVDAVQRWRYRPTMLNGEPVKVETTIDVNFTLAQ